ncbi:MULTISPECIES: DUF4150 domain-containing protein [Burkholderia]|mgnify:CR=1 FL=1|uniref:DUF4150 domain-containing protein n=1 Tax=Burkholderia TaxID=32008 RepID=UPI00157BA663|nr:MULTISPECIES: DUF4150 domain-containing protein [Burkholderia]MCU9952184.1 DUF4150 domain-containing protein [Burkholderia sp. BKH01]NTY40152.1 DUF4150 domain-containing protein [Burkholderia diffusa]
MFVVTTASGLCMSPVDVCKTPTPGGPVPVPYPNTGLPMMAESITTKVLVCGMPALTKKSTIPMTNGDQPGTAGGAMSGKIMGKVEFAAGSTKVKFEGNPAVRLTTPTKHNEGNATGAVLQPSQQKVMAMS